jgi:CheY-like chemotaxis protein
VDAALATAGDGEEALRRLRRQAPYQGEAAPDLIFLDINLPRKNGRDVLREIKQDPRLSPIPVLMLTTSSADSDLQACYRAHANSYLKKPLDFDEFVELVRVTCDYWVRRALVPAAPAAA